MSIQFIFELSTAPLANLGPCCSHQPDPTPETQGLGGRPGMQDMGGIRVRRRMDKNRRVPTDQQPFNELQELKEDPLFGWAQEDLKVCNQNAR